MNTWTTNRDGSVTVNGSVPLVATSQLNVFCYRTMRWAHSAAVASAAFAVPWHWIMGTIWAESGGEPNALSPDGGYGLMQLTSPSVFEGAAPETTRDNPADPSDDVMDPARNIALGVRFMARLRLRLGDLGTDLVAVASGYNAGLEADGTPHASAASPWGFRETSGHIIRVVEGANSALQEMQQRRIPGCYTWEYVGMWQRFLGIADDCKFGPKTLSISRAGWGLK